jgi:hypothetical protein
MTNLLGRLKTNGVGHTHYFHTIVKKTTKITSTNNKTLECIRKKKIITQRAFLHYGAQLWEVHFVQFSAIIVES